ncbi:alpha/beta fold hydrolase [Streptomyces sp. NA04227]|uniref:alpha/beta hydrolase n=1 Tax=Streptomyces sp. NA04227 TaxID=2742136 RepID=UPI00159088C4|nr:alpha/beta hydrolase [Streptomyces sp. NA04227]QKW08801.1 alpha/beta fold hydrolase [Streptomyces sp. NA04227]
MSRAVRVGALTLAAALIVTGAAACGDDDGGSDGGGGDGTRAAADDSSSSPAGSGDLPGSLTGQKLDWQTCEASTPAQGSGPPPGARWQCATMKAPRDYAKPDGATVDLALIRSRATDESERIGSLLYNFGGPGASGVATLPSLGPSYKTLNKRYDLVSFDPRGIGESEGVKCLSDKQTDAALAAESTPDDAAERKRYVAEDKKALAACERRSGPILPHVDTVSAARDMDLMREVLGDKKLYYFGISYGTELGGVYAHEYPENVGRMVLDAVVDPTEDVKEGSLGQAKGFQLALDNFMKACAKQDGCPTGKGGAAGSKKVADLLKKLDEKPLPTSDDRELTETLAQTGIISALYSQEQWPYLAAGLNEAMNKGTGDLLLLLADSYNGRDRKGRYSTQGPSNRAVNCVDDKERYSVEDVEQSLPAFREASPVFGDSLAWGMYGCTGWPVKGETNGPEVSAKGAAPIVVIGNTGDPATPYAGARKMAEALGKGVGVNVTLKGEGHGGYNTGNPCLQKVVDGYLLNGKVPAPNTTCTA